MLFKDMQPFVRLAQTLSLTNKNYFYQTVALDARLFLVQSGEGIIKVDGKDYSLKKDDLLIINSGIPYQICTPEKQVSFSQVNFDYNLNASHISFPINPVKAQSFSRDMLVNYVEFEDCPALSTVLYIEKMADLQKRLNNIINEFSLQLMHFKEKMTSLLTSCIIDAVRAFNLVSLTDQDQTKGEVIKYVHDNYQLPLTNAFVGKAFNYHPNYISQLIKNATGMPLHKYLIHVRLIKAVSLLQNTTLSINDIAIECGFCDSAYFSGYFKKAFKVSPSKFRNV